MIDNNDKYVVANLPINLSQRFLNSGYKVVESIKDCDDLSKIEVIIGKPEKDILIKCNQLKWLQLESAGTNGYENKHLYSNSEISLTTSSGVYGIPIAEFVIGSMLLMGKQSISNHIGIRFGGTLKMPHSNDIELNKASILIFGCGDIGQQISRRLLALGCNQVIGVNRSGNQADNFSKVVSLSKCYEYIAESDYIISAMPENNESINFWNLEKFKMMKNNCIFINVGRGSAVIEKDIEVALKKNIISGAVLDVCSQEPISKFNKFRYTKRLILTNHSSYYSNHNKERYYNILEENIEHYLSKEKLVNLYTF